MQEEEVDELARFQEHTPRAVFQDSSKTPSSPSYAVGGAATRRAAQAAPLRLDRAGRRNRVIYDWLFIRTHTHTQSINKRAAFNGDAESVIIYDAASSKVNFFCFIGPNRSAIVFNSNQ